MVNPIPVSGPGKIEPYTEEIEVGSELSGRLKSVKYAEGQFVRPGEVIAELENSDYWAATEFAKAEVESRRASLAKLISGARRQERELARADLEEKKAIADKQLSDLERQQQLYKGGIVSKETLSRFVQDAAVAQAQYDSAMQKFSLIQDNPREEDRRIAEAELRMAEAKYEEAKADYRKTFIQSPIGGTVLRVHHRAGESISNSSMMPDPVVTIGDNKILHVRVEVDESDITRVTVGNRAYVMAEAFGRQKFWGKVIRVGQELGPKKIRTDDPREKVDTKVLEVILQLDSPPALPDGLRVDAFIFP